MSTFNDVANLQGYFQHRFHYYRNGLPNYQDSRDHIIEQSNLLVQEYQQRLADINQRIASLPGQPGAANPPAGNFNFTTNHRDRLRNLAVPNREPLRTVQPQIGTTDVTREMRQVVEDEYTKAYRLMRASFRYIKCLGWGGDGIVSLWKYSPEPAQGHMVVMKMSAQWEHVTRNGRRARMVTRYIDTERDVITVSLYRV